jgi:hypothetical protein
VNDTPLGPESMLADPVSGNAAPWPGSAEATFAVLHHGPILEHHLDILGFDEQGNRYLSAALDDYRNFDGPELATKIRITWFQEKLVLDLKLKDVKINTVKVTDNNFMHRKPEWAD